MALLKILIDNEVERKMKPIQRSFDKAKRDVEYYRNMYFTEMCVRMQKEMEILELKMDIEHLKEDVQFFAHQQPEVL